MTPLELGLLIGLGYPVVALGVARWVWWHDDRRGSSNVDEVDDATLDVIGWSVFWPLGAVLLALALVCGGLAWLVTTPGPRERKERRLGRARDNVARLEQELGVDESDRMAT